MKNSVLKAAAIAGFSVLGASSGFAQSATQTINLSSAVNASCLINGTANGGGADSGQSKSGPAGRQTSRRMRASPKSSRYDTVPPTGKVMGRTIGSAANAADGLIGRADASTRPLARA